MITLMRATTDNSHACAIKMPLRRHFEAAYAAAALLRERIFS